MDKMRIVEQALATARRLGADAADAVLFAGQNHSLQRLKGRTEKHEQSDSLDLGLRVFVGAASAIASSNDFSSSGMQQLAERAIAMARLVPVDDFAALATPDSYCQHPPSMELLDEFIPSAEWLRDQADEAETEALAIADITNSEGASASWHRGEFYLMTSAGFVGSYATSSFHLSLSVIAGTGTQMERDYDYSSAIFHDDLHPAASLGRRAGERASRRLNPQKLSSQTVPVIYEPRVAASLLRHLLGAINGASIARGVSFLKDDLGQQIFSPTITIIDDPFRPRGLRSRPFDGEGLLGKKTALIEQGRLNSWLLDIRSARQLGLAPTGHASRGTSAPPSPSCSNLYLCPGQASLQDLLADIKQGFYVTDLLGSGVNMVTGDYSRGASGFWIENGQITYPVSGMTIAGNLKTMFQNLRAANDLEFTTGIDAPHLRVDAMMCAGE